QEGEGYATTAQYISRASSLPPPLEINLSPDNRYITTRINAIWTITNLETNEHLELGHPEAEVARFSPDASLVVLLDYAAGETTDSVQAIIVDARTANLISVFELENYSRLTQTFAISPDNSTIVFGQETGRIRLQDIHTGEILRDFDG